MGSSTGWLIGGSIIAIVAAIILSKKAGSSSGIVSNAKVAATYSNGLLTFKASGLAANSLTQVIVKESGGYVYVTTDATGGLYYSFAITDPAGTYTLELTDSDGNTAQTTFQVG